jgi:hypothetical protein
MLNLIKISSQKGMEKYGTKRQLKAWKLTEAKSRVRDRLRQRASRPLRRATSLDVVIP